MRTYNVIIGSKAFFEASLPEYDDSSACNFLELVRLADAAKQRGTVFSNTADMLILKNDDYHGIVESAHDRLGGLIEDLTEENARIYVHNPPRVLKEYLKEQKRRSIIDLDIKNEEYNIENNAAFFVSKMQEIASKIIGQGLAIEEISKSMWYLTTTTRKKPYVVMLYGNSSLGKTELVREIAEKFYSGKCLEKHLSMFKNDSYADYFFGNQPNRRSIGFDLLERESNLLFLDELDKCPEHFYSAFYTLFDNVQFKDATYDVNISGTLIILTSNYQSEEEMKKVLGAPIFYRIDKFIHFEDFSCETIYAITKNEIEARKEEYQGKMTPDMVYAAVCPLIGAKGENARTIKYKVQQVIEELLFRAVSGFSIDASKREIEKQ